MSLEKSLRALQSIWDGVAAKAPDGNKCIFFNSRTDIEYLYATGFVDEKQFSLQEWIDSFSDSLQPDGRYLVNEIQWMDKARYRYSGPVGAPFDPMTLREGEWTEEEIKSLAKEKLFPSVYFSVENFEKIMEDVKKGPYYVNGKFIVNQAVKADWAWILNEYPSPRRIREMRLMEARTAAHPTGQKGPSRFTSEPPPSQKAAERLRAILSKGGS